MSEPEETPTDTEAPPPEDAEAPPSDADAPPHDADAPPHDADAPPPDADAPDAVGPSEDEDAKPIDDDEEVEEEDTGPVFPAFARTSTDQKIELLMAEYMKIVMLIDSQNRIIKEIKNKIKQKCSKCIRNKCTETEIRNLRCCLEKENLKLRCLMKKAICLQKEIPKQKWNSLQIATNFDEDSMPFNACKLMSGGRPICGDFMQSTLSDKEQSQCEDKEEKDQENDENDDDLSCDEFNNFLSCLSKQLEGMNEYKPAKHKKFECTSKPQRPCGGDPCEEDNVLDSKYFEKELKRNSCLEKDKYKMQGDLLSRDRKIECLQKKIQQLQREICRAKQNKIRETTPAHLKSPCSPPPELKNLNKRSKHFEKMVCKMKSSVEEIKTKMDYLKKEQDQLNRQKQDQSCGNICPKEGFQSPLRKKTQADKFKNLKESYCAVLSNLAKKQAELKDLKEKVNNYIEKNATGDDECGGGSASEDPNKYKHEETTKEAEIKVLQEKLQDLTEEQQEFKLLIREQSQQLEEIRCKYLNSQQIVEEQKAMLDKFNINNEQIEEQISLEVKRITQKFQEKCAELEKFPKMLEDEQIRLSDIMGEKDEVKQKLALMCKEYSILREQWENRNTDGTNYQAKCIQAEQELRDLKEKLQNLQKNKNLMMTMLEKAKEDYETIMSESFSILERTRERAEHEKCCLCEHINKLEKDLAQNRAACTLNITDREELIKEMQGQINTLNYSFDAAKDQINCLRSQITFLCSCKEA